MLKNQITKILGEQIDFLISIKETMERHLSDYYWVDGDEKLSILDNIYINIRKIIWSGIKFSEITLEEKYEEDDKADKEECNIWDYILKNIEFNWRLYNVL